MRANVKSIIYFALVMIGVGLIPAPVGSQVFFSARGLLSSHFQKSERVEFVRVRPTGDSKRRVERKIGHALKRAEYTFYVARTAGRPDGFALFDSEKGQHEPIDVATFFDASGQVGRVEIVAYREAYGDGIRSNGFRKQFVGRTGRSTFRVGNDIDVISGATISSRSLTRAVHRATVLLDELVLPKSGSQLQAKR